MALALGLAIAASVMGPAPRPADAAVYDRFYANFQSAELMRAINADREALGRAPLRADPALAAAARDRPIACPSDPGLTIHGRARDLAERSYLSHDVKGCQASDGQPFSTFDLLEALGHGWASAGENIASNNFPSKKVDYRTGCASGGGGCAGSIELPWSVAVVTGGWMDSPGHRAVMLSSTFTRFGCGAWQGGGGHHAFACFFVAGGGGSVDRAGPQIRSRSGDGATYQQGATPRFTALANDGGSLLAQGRALLDGRVIKQWAYDHAGSSDELAVQAPPLKPGDHTLTWWIRDTSTNTRTAHVTFTVTGDPGRSKPEPKPEPKPERPPKPEASSEPVPSSPAATIELPAFSQSPAAPPDPAPSLAAAAGAPAARASVRPPDMEQRRRSGESAPIDASLGRDRWALGFTIAAAGFVSLISVALLLVALRRRARAP